jgi:peptidyl-dipeptidase A
MHFTTRPKYNYAQQYERFESAFALNYIARKILHQPPQSCNYADNKEVGAWLNNILKKGATED